MKSIAIVGLALLVGCGGASPQQATGTGGASSSVTVGVGGAGGTGGSGGAPVVYQDIGNGACDAFETPIGPLNGRLTDPNGQPIGQDGAIAMLRVVPPAYPWTAVSVTYGLASSGLCDITDHEVVTFVGPADGAPPLHPEGATVTPVSASDIVAQGGGATVATTFAAPVTVESGQALWVGVRMHVVPMGGGARTCVFACDDVAKPGDPASWFSDVNDGAMVDLCPEDQCTLNLLGESPSKVDGPKLGNDRRRWPYVVTGHK